MPTVFIIWKQRLDNTLPPRDNVQPHLIGWPGLRPSTIALFKLRRAAEAVALFICFRQYGLPHFSDFASWQRKRFIWLLRSHPPSNVSDAVATPAGQGLSRLSRLVHPPRLGASAGFAHDGAPSIQQVAYARGSAPRKRLARRGSYWIASFRVVASKQDDSFALQLIARSYNGCDYRK